MIKIIIDTSKDKGILIGEKISGKDMESAISQLIFQNLQPSLTPELRVIK